MLRPQDQRQLSHQRKVRVEPNDNARHPVGAGGRNYRIAVALLLAIAYSASISGMTTLIGTPPTGRFSGSTT